MAPGEGAGGTTLAVQGALPLGQLAAKPVLNAFTKIFSGFLLVSG